MQGYKQLKSHISEVLKKKENPEEKSYWEQYYEKHWEKLYDKYIWEPWYDINYGIGNFYRWRKVIWNDRNWGYDGLLNVMEAKMEMFRKKFVENDMVADIQFMNRDLKIAIKLIQRIRDEYYQMEYHEYHDEEMEYHEYHDEEMIFNDKPDKKLFRLEFVENWEKFDDFIKKYPHSHREVLKEQAEPNPKWKSLESKKTLCLAIAIHNHDKARKLLFKIMEEKIETWFG
jgi:hypothetical protein